MILGLDVLLSIDAAEFIYLSHLEECNHSAVMRITEIFNSLQGEGPDTGRPTTFVRTAGCNLRCAWCDTPYSLGEGLPMTVTEVIAKVKTYGTHQICLTGGEPLLQQESLELTRELSRLGFSVLVMTGGSIDVSPYLSIPNVRISLDVKCPSSTMEKRTRVENIPLLRPQDVAKFVIQDRADYDFAKKFLKEHPIASEVVFQPTWGSDSSKLAGWVLGDALGVRVMLQQHKYIWGEVPGR
jgi:7-carboxy-7-deazaguanine synthase